MPGADIQKMPYYPGKDPDPKIRDFLLRPEDHSENQLMFRLDPALENALAEQNASIRDGSKGGEYTYRAPAPVMRGPSDTNIDFMGVHTL